MDQQAREQAFMNALATEHFVLQAGRSAIVGEQVGRVTIYMGAVSGALIAFGFLAQVLTRLDPFVIAVLPALFVLGELTFAALWHNTLENLVLLHKMQAIRGYYRGLVPEASQFFDAPEADVQYQAALARWGCGWRRCRCCSPGPVWSRPSTASWAAPGWRCWRLGWASWAMGWRWGSAWPSP
jgi:hypothetical protein